MGWSRLSVGYHYDFKLKLWPELESGLSVLVLESSLLTYRPTPTVSTFQSFCEYSENQERFLVKYNTINLYNRQVKRTILIRFSQQYISQSNITADFLGARSCLHRKCISQCINLVKSKHAGIIWLWTCTVPYNILNSLNR